MKCKNCGTELKKGVFFCPACGKEVQWVPEYNTLENIMRMKKAAEEERRRKELEAQKERERAQRLAEQERRRKRKKRNRILGVAAAFAAVCSGVLFYFYQKQNHSFDFRMAQAETKFSNKEYEEAMKYVERALALLPQNPQANILEAKIYLHNGNADAAEAILNSVIQSDPENTSAYGELLRLYEADEKTEKIQELMEDAGEKIQTSFSEYICQLPQVSEKGGEYDQELQLTFAPPEGVQIYYTLDNTDPDQDSVLYEGSPVMIVKEGKTTLKYIAYNALGIASETGSEVYHLTFPVPDAPSVTPSSGRYNPDVLIEVTAPEGCVVYYSFDSAPTLESSLYTGPVSIPQGEHIFMAVAVDARGKTSRTVSEAYVNYGW